MTKEVAEVYWFAPASVKLCFRSHDIDKSLGTPNAPDDGEDGKLACRHIYSESTHNGMSMAINADSAVTCHLLDQARQGDQRAWSDLLSRNHERLRRMVALRLDQRLQGRVDADDVLQEALLEAATHLNDYVRSPGSSFFLWLRGVVGNVLLATHRQHLGTKMRDAHREVALYRGPLPEASSAAMAAHLLGKDTRPSEAAVRAERKILLQQALNTLDSLDREILALRHFEQLSTAEAAQVLGINQAAAGKRYIRAMKRLKEVLLDLPGGDGAFDP